ncbi:hypothetical protein BSG1_00890 [Bacillus sp. SG-1]|nr:hypothetical protein BSG1_00890 [Bacillus sp. SG-1]
MQKKAVIYRNSLVSKERKELLSLFIEKKTCNQGKNPALGIFPKVTIYMKTALLI